MSGESGDDVVALSDDGSAESMLTPERLKEMKEQMSCKANKFIREKYRDLLINQQKKVDEAGKAALPIEDLRAMIHAANEAVIKVKRPREATLDAEYLRTCGLLMKNTIESKKFNNTEFHPSEFANKMQMFMDDNTRNTSLQDPDMWKRLGQAVSSLYASAVPLESPLAVIGFEKPQKVRNQRRKIEVGEKVVPKVVREGANDEERQTEELNRIYRILKKKFRENNMRPLCYYSFVLNPHSYCYTIENIFHISFLVHMMRAEIMEGTNGIPVIIPRKTDMSKGKSQEPSNHQSVVTLSTDEYKDLVRVFKIRQSCVPPPQNIKKRT